MRKLIALLCAFSTCAGLFLATSLGAAGASEGGGQGFGWNDPGGTNIGAQDGDAQSGAHGSQTGSTGGAGTSGSDAGATTCTAHGVTGPITSKVVPDNVVEGWYTGGHSPSWAHGYDEPGTFYYVYCGGVFYNVEYISAGTTPPGGGPPAQTIDPRVLAVAASKNIPIGQFTINLSPTPPTDQLVGLPVWMWVSGDALGTKTDSVTAGTVTVVATATATAIRFDMGNHQTVSCSAPDAITDPRPTGKTSCSYSYPRSSAPRSDHVGDSYTIKATVVWAVNYTVAGAAGGGPLPAITRTATTTVRVAEAQALNTK